MKRLLLLAASVAASCLLAGCGTVSPTVVTHTTQVTGFGGRVHGGINPVSGATVQLWAAGSTGYGSAATALGSSVTTGSDGGFYLGNSGIVCPASNPYVYLTATGGNPGYPTPTNNDALYLMTAIGTCNSITANSFWVINEVSTIASAYALAQFTDFTTGSIGTYGSNNSGYNISGLANAFNMATLLYNAATGTANSVTPNGNGVVPQQEINTLANIITPCINSTSKTSPACEALFGTLQPTAGVGPAQPLLKRANPLVHPDSANLANTMEAALYIASSPGRNPAGLYALALANPAFQPALTGTTPPNDFSLALGFHSGAVEALALAIDSTGNIWVGDFGNGGAGGKLVELNPQGVPVSGSPFSTGIGGTYAVSIDTQSNIWALASFTNQLVELNNSGSPIAGPYAVGRQPEGMAIDAANNIWVTGYNGFGPSSFIDQLYTPLGQIRTFTGGGLSAPIPIAFDTSGNAWIANFSDNTISEFTSGGVPVPASNVSVTGEAAPSGVALDSSNNIWIGNSAGGDVSEVTAGTLASRDYSVGGYSGAAYDVAFDGSNVLWSAGLNNTLDAITDDGSAYAPSTGFQAPVLAYPNAIAVDSSGNVWLINNAQNTVNGIAVDTVAFVGIATPVTTPIAQNLANGALNSLPGTPIPVTIQTTTLPYFTVGSNYSVQLQATGGNSGSYTWIPQGGSLPPGMGFDTTTGVISGVPSLPIPAVFLVEAADAANPANASTIRVLAIPDALPDSGTCGSVNCASLLNGRFAIELSGYKGGKPSTTGAVTGWAALGSLAFDGSGNVSGTIDYNDASTTGTASTLTVSGSYSLGTDGRGTLLLSSGTGSMPQQYTFAVSKSNTYLNLQEFDYANPTSTTTGLATGVGKLQTPGASNPSTDFLTYVFGMDGETPCSSCNGTVSPYGPLSVAGQFANLADFLSGEEDAAAVNNAYPQVSLGGPELSAPNSTTGRGTITLYAGTSYPAPPSDYVYYVVNSNEIMLLSVDGHATHSLLAGDALVQTTTFSSTVANNNLIFSGNYILTQNASYNGDGVNFYPNTSNVALSYIASPGSGLASIIQDQNTAGIITPENSLGTLPYSIDQNGRMTFTGAPLTLYLANGTSGFGTLQPNTPANDGGVPGLLTLLHQTGSPSCSSLSGTYSFGNPRPPTSMTTNTGVLTVSGTTGTLTLDSSNPSGVLTSGATNTYTCSTDADTSTLGRLTFTNSSGGSEAVYVISPTRAVIMDNTPNKTKPALTFLQSQ